MSVITIYNSVKIWFWGVITNIQNFCQNFSAVDIVHLACQWYYCMCVICFTIL